MSKLTTHVLDTSRGRPAEGVPVRLEIALDGMFHELSARVTDADGRVKDLLPADTPLEAATYRLTFDTGAYFTARGTTSFYPSVSILFQVRETEQHHHVPLLLNPFGYSTYRGS
jgi:5-hydroxyisourate hydrolase